MTITSVFNQNEELRKIDMNRALSNDFIESLQNGELKPIMDIIKKDSSLDLEMRGNEVMVYYKGLKLLTITNQKGIYLFKELDPKYRRRKNDVDVELPVWDRSNPEDYFIKAKNIIDTYDMKGFWEYEIKQMVVRENNTSTNAKDTDFYVIDTEYQNIKKDQFDIIALHIDSSTEARVKAVASLAIIEIKQGIGTLRTTNSNPGIKRHLEDFNKHLEDAKRKKNFIDDMKKVFRQKCQLGLIKGLSQNTINKLRLREDVEFFVLLTNYKKASSNLVSELRSFKDECNFLTSFFTGYGLYSHSIKNKEEILQLLER